MMHITKLVACCGVGFLALAWLKAPVTVTLATPPAYAATAKPHAWGDTWIASPPAGAPPSVAAAPAPVKAKAKPAKRKAKPIKAKPRAMVTHYYIVHGCTCSL